MNDPGTAVAQGTTQSLEDQRWERSQQILAERAQRQLAEMSDDEFERQISLQKKALDRIQRVIRELFVRDKHFGNPAVGTGKAFQKDICYQGGADLLQQTFRLHVEMIGEPIVVADETWCSVTIRAGIYNQFGGELGQTIASCNTLEPRFYKGNGSTPTWKREPREKLNDCQAMALKRAAVRLSLAVTGGSAFFVSDDALAEAFEVEPCSAEDRTRIKKAARAKGMQSEDFWSLVLGFTGRQRQAGENFPVIADNEVEGVLRLIGAWQPRAEVKAETIHTDPPRRTARTDDPDRDPSFDQRPSALDDTDDGFPA